MIDIDQHTALSYPVCISSRIAIIAAAPGPLSPSQAPLPLWQGVRSRSCPAGPFWHGNAGICHSVDGSDAQIRNSMNFISVDLLMRQFLHRELVRQSTPCQLRQPIGSSNKDGFGITKHSDPRLQCSMRNQRHVTSRTSRRRQYRFLKFGSAVVRISVSMDPSASSAQPQAVRNGPRPGSA